MYSPYGMPVMAAFPYFQTTPVTGGYFKTEDTASSGNPYQALAPTDSPYFNQMPNGTSILSKAFSQHQQYFQQWDHQPNQYEVIETSAGG